jgi:hypothetical protein
MRELALGVRRSAELRINWVHIAAVSLQSRIHRTLGAHA